MNESLPPLVQGAGILCFIPAPCLYFHEIQPGGYGLDFLCSALGKQPMTAEQLRILLQKSFRIFGKTIDKGRDPIYNIPKSDHNNGFGKEEHSMRYAAVSENMMMYMGMCRMCMRTLRYALNSETFSALGK